MTQEDLDALPEVVGVALFTGDDDGMVWDQQDQRWMVGWLDGVRVKQKAM